MNSNLKILVGITTFILIFAMLFIANVFFGNPVTASMAKRKAQSYINEKYSNLNLEIKHVTYNSKDGYYFVSIISSTSIDTHFSLSYEDGEIFRDNYASSVLSGMNTMDRFCNEYKRNLTLLVQVKNNDVTNISIIPEKLVKYNIDLDSSFDKELIKNVDIWISCIGSTEVKHLSNILKTTYDIMKDNGYVAIKFGITSQNEGALIELGNIKPSHIENNNLEEILQQAITKTEYDGITAFSKGQK